MEPNKRQKLFVFLLAFSIVIYGICFFCVNRPRNLNVILITIDALRPDHLSCYGYKRNTSPNIDKLAKEGVIFTQAVSQASLTPPSIFSILTSTYSNTHGVYDFGEIMNSALITLPEILKDNGYYLVLISGRGRLAEFRFPKLEEKFDIFYPSNINYITADEITKNAIEWLRLNKSKRFFLWLFYLDPHTPYKPPFPYNKEYVNDEFAKENNKYIPIADESRNQFDGYGVIPRITAIKDITDINYYISQYDGEIRFVDSQLGAVFTELKRLNLYDNTIIVITSDHGESMGEHDFYFVHGQNLFDELLKVSLIIRYRGIGKNKRISRQVQSIDIMPTILDIIRIKIPKEVAGVSLLPLIKKGQYYAKYAFSEKRGCVSIRTENWKLIYSVEENQYSLYNLKDDPEETNNLDDIEKSKFQFLKNELHKWMEKQSKITTQKRVLDEATKEKLRSLGYVR